jgi:multidrug resistance efflux pump
MVQPLEGGVIRSINVKVGDIVKAGDVLMEIDPDYQSKKDNLDEISGEIECITELLRGSSGKSKCVNTAKYLSAKNNMLKLRGRRYLGLGRR